MKNVIFTIVLGALCLGQLLVGALLILLSGDAFVRGQGAGMLQGGTAATFIVLIMRNDNVRKT